MDKDKTNNNTNNNHNNNAPSSRKRAQPTGRFHRYLRCFRHFRCRLYRCCRRSRHLQMRGHSQSADMHFTWPAWDKTQSRLALFRKCVCVASVSVCCGNPFCKKKMYFCVGKRQTQISEKRDHMHFTWPAWDKTQSR